MSDYPRETTEYLFVNVTIDGQTTTAGVELAIQPQTGTTTARPTTWTAATIVDNKTAHLIHDQDPGLYRVWARVTTTDSPEIPVIDCGLYRIT